MTELHKKLGEILGKHQRILANISRKDMIEYAIRNGDAIASANGCLATWTPPESTGRSPKDTLTVKTENNENNIDWNSPYNLPIDVELFDMLYHDAMDLLQHKKELYITERVIGADVKYALPVRTITCSALTALFTDNMFRPIPDNINESVFFERNFTLLVLPYDKLDANKYEGKLRKLPNGKTSDMVVAMDYDRRIGLIIGSAYMGSVKKLMFTVMNYYLPAENVLPLHCSANEGKDGDSAFLLGLSGTGKTTLSADPDRALLGDDEHGWSETGIFNFENGCYAKMINIKAEKEPEIYNAVMHKADYKEHGAIVENAMIYPDGVFDFDDDRLTPNSRSSYPLEFLTNIKKSSISGHPKVILFLTADAYGVLPPVAKLNTDQAMLWFLMGYTSKLAGTETGIVEPEATFSRFFGEPFMPRNPDVYAEMLGEKIKKHNVKVYLINTGWIGGKYGVGKRIDLKLTRAMVNAALLGDLEKVEYEKNELFHLNIPKSCPNVPTNILNPMNTWENKEEYIKIARKLAQAFSDHFDKAYGNKNIRDEIRIQCPGK